MQEVDNCGQRGERGSRSGRNVRIFFMNDPQGNFLRYENTAGFPFPMSKHLGKASSRARTVDLPSRKQAHCPPCYHAQRCRRTERREEAPLLPLKSTGKGGKSTLPMLSTDRILSTFSFCIRSSVRLGLLFSSGIHHLP